MVVCKYIDGQTVRKVHKALQSLPYSKYNKNIKDHLQDVEG